MYYIEHVKVKNILRNSQFWSFEIFRITFRGASVLVSTDVAAMGLDVSDLNLSVNIGMKYKKRKNI